LPVLRRAGPQRTAEGDNHPVARERDIALGLGNGVIFIADVEGEQP
jgi:hypothetical protein